MPGPFSVLHVCMGNICRSPMGERLLLARLRDAVGDRADQLVHSHSAGTGGWHAGEPMNPPAARQVVARGGEPAGFAAHQLRGADVDRADLILTATVEQVGYVLDLRDDAASRTFVVGEFGRLLADLTGDPALADLPPYEPTVAAVHARGVALVAAVDRLRAGEPARPEDELDDPWGLGDTYFGQVADELERHLRPLVAALTAGSTGSQVELIHRA